MIAQIYGMPTSGKTTFIREFINRNKNWTWLDVANWNKNPSNWLIAESNIFKQIKAEPDNNYIVESVSGFWQLDSKNILFKCEFQDMVLRHEKRRKTLNNDDLDYYNILMSQSIKPHLIINTSIFDTYEKIKMRLQSIIETL